MRRFAIITLAALALTGCKSLAVETPAQGLYAALGGYSAALTGARAYAEGPTANPAIVHIIATATEKAAPALAIGRAYVTCSSAPTSPTITAVDVSGVAVPCARFDFSAAGLQSAAIALRNAAITLGSR